MINSGYLSYALCDSKFARRNKLPRLSVSPLTLEPFNGGTVSVAKEVTSFTVDIDGYKEKIFAYITPLGGYNIYLGMP